MSCKARGCETRGAGAVILEQGTPQVKRPAPGEGREPNGKENLHGEHSYSARLEAQGERSHAGIGVPRSAAVRGPHGRRGGPRRRLARLPARRRGDPAARPARQHPGHSHRGSLSRGRERSALHARRSPQGDFAGGDRGHLQQLLRVRHGQGWRVAQRRPVRGPPVGTGSHGSRREPRRLRPRGTRTRVPARGADLPAPLRGAVVRGRALDRLPARPAAGAGATAEQCPLRRLRDLQPAGAGLRSEDAELVQVALL